MMIGINFSWNTVRKILELHIEYYESIFRWDLCGVQMEGETDSPFEM